MIQRKSTARYYLDTSAYVELLVKSRKGDALRAELDGGAIVASVLLVAEARRNLLRLSREHAIEVAAFVEASQQLERDLESFNLRDVTLELCNDTRFPAASLPRSADLIHLRTALWFHQLEPLTRFVSFDEAQNLAAHEFHLPVERATSA